MPDRESAIAEADVIVTVTGAPGVIGATASELFGDGTILLNAGHLPWEIDVAGITAGNETTSATDGIETVTLADGRRIQNTAVAGPRPLGNSVESMDLGFALQARCLEAVARGEVGAEACVVPVPRAIDEAVARAFVALA